MNMNKRVCKVIAMANQKGGVGKTTSTANLGASLAKLGYKVLMIDCDPQGSLSISFGLQPYQLRHTLCDVLKENPEPIANCIRELKCCENLYLLPTRIELATLEMGLMARYERELLLTTALESIKQYFDYIVIDCPPQLSLLTLNALVASDNCIAIAKCDYLSFEALQFLYDTISKVQDMRCSHVVTNGVFVTMYESSTNDCSDVLEALNMKYDVIGMTNKRTDVNKGLADGLPVVINIPSCDASKEYMKLAKFVTNNFEREDGKQYVG